MNNGDMRSELNRLWDEIDQEARWRKDSQSALLALERMYRSLDERERRQADAVIIEWALSEDAKKHFDGLALIDRFCIRAAVSALHELIGRLLNGKEASAPYDLAKVQRILHRISASEERSSHGR